MTGFVETVGGWFGSCLICKMLDTVGTYLGNNNALQSGTAEMLTSLKNSLPQIQYAIVEARKMPTKNPELIEWLDNLKNAAYEVKDVLDDFEAKRIRENFKKNNKVIESGKFVKALFLPDKELMELKSVEEKFSKITGEVRDFLDHLRNEYSTNANRANTYRRETSSYLDPNLKIFGRDVEIYFILDTILNYQLMCFFKENSEPESQPNPQREGEPKLPDQKEAIETSSFSDPVQESKGKRKWSSGTSSEVGKESMKLEISNIKSNVGDQSSVRIRNWKLPVLPICGLGGVGKTTIAQMIYNNNIVTQVFGLRAWVYVSEKFDVNTIMKKIVDSLNGRSNISIHTNINPTTWEPTASSSRRNDRELIERELKLTIQNRRFFLVLDDIYDEIESIWRDLFSVLSNGAPNSFILLTTRSERVAKTIGNMPIIINLDALEPEWFDLLFKSYAFGELFSFDRKSGKCSVSCKNNTSVAQFVNLREEELTVLESIASKIAKKLHGLPLAGRLIGKMLYDKLGKVHWEKILKSDWWELDEKNISEEIIASLEIGYKDLDPELQHCFKFCSIFPRNYVFDRNTLVQMWLAHDFDFVQPNQRESFKLHRKEIRLEDVGGERFDKLVDRSFFQATVSDGKYVMHDLIREFAIAVSSKQEFYHVESLDYKIPPVTRHIGINCDGSNREEISPIYTNLRTVILFGNWMNFSSESIRNILAKSNGLRLLDLSYFWIKDNETFDAISRQSHLRFVDLSFSGIDFIPEIFCELYHLQLLDVRGCVFRKLPKGMSKLINLRHLYASAETVSQISGIGKLTKLQELEEFRIGENNGHRISELRDMNEIGGHLLLVGLQNVTNKEEAAICQLDKKRYLKSLELTYSHKDQLTTMQSKLELDVLEALKTPPNVEILTIRGGRGGSLPGWMWSSQCGLSNLKCIKVSNFSLTTLPAAFGALPSLEVLSFDSLHKLEMVGDEFYGSSNVVFPSLKELKFLKMFQWRTWLDAPVEKKSFPLLKKINLEDCVGLMEMPTNIFTSSLLVELKLLKCRNINNIETILKRMPHLTHLSITECCNLSIYCTALRFLEVLCLKDVTHLCFVGGIKSLVNLRKLDLTGFCEILESFDEEENDGTCHDNRFLTYLYLGYFHSHPRLPFAGRLRYLCSLLIRESPVIEYTEEEERWFTQLTSLEMLTFSYSLQLRSLPSTLPMLTKLKNLTIVCCPMISSLPEFGLPPNLTELYIILCSEDLVHRCQPNQGDDWQKISHIPHIQIDRHFSFQHTA